MSTAAAPGELGAAGTGLVPLSYGDVAGYTDFMFDGVNQLWWRFTAPDSGIYAFDAALCNIGGADPTADSPYTNVTILNIDGSAPPVLLGGTIPDTSLGWAGVTLTLGQQVDIGVVAVSSIADFLGGTNVSVLTNVRSNLLDAVVLRQEAPAGHTWVARGDESQLTVTRPAADSEGGRRSYGFIAMIQTNGTVAPTISIPTGGTFSDVGHWAGGTDVIGDPVSPTTYSGGSWYGLENTGLDLEMTFDIHGATVARWIVLQFDYGTSTELGRTSARVVGYSTGVVSSANTVNTLDGGGFLTAWSMLGPSDRSEVKWVGVASELGGELFDLSHLAFGRQRLDSGPLNRAAFYVPADDLTLQKAVTEPVTASLIEMAFAVALQDGSVYDFTPSPVTPTEIEAAFDLSRCRFV